MNRNNKSDSINSRSDKGILIIKLHMICSPRHQAAVYVHRRTLEGYRGMNVQRAIGRNPSLGKLWEGVNGESAS